MSNRPEWCPEDIWFKAQNAVGFDSGCDCGHCCQTGGLIEPVARAILAERERCSKIAGSELRNTSMLMSNPPQSGAAWDIRNAIDVGTPAP